MVNWGLLGAVVLPNVGGWTAALSTAQDTSDTDWYDSIKKPKWNPPEWVFGTMWTGLYSSMGYASYLVYKDCGGFTEDAILPLTLYGGQLLINWAWTSVFFKYHKIGLALFHLLAINAAATACTVSFYRINKNTLFFMAPYLGWLGFATFLNFTYWKLNRSDKKE